MEHEPCRLLRNFEVFCESCASDAFGMVRDNPHRHEPLAKRQFRILKDRGEFDLKAGAAIAAIESLMIREMINPVRSAMRAKRTVAPTDSAEMVNTRLFVGESYH